MNTVESNACPPLIAGAAAVDITPGGPQFLFGYPHVARTSTGVHDPLLSSALFLSDGQTSLVFVANDVIYIDRGTAARTRERIAEATGIPAANVLITATHTHSGPMTVDLLCCESDPVVPKTDPCYVEHFEEGIVRAAVTAWRNARPASVGLAVADGSCVGGNRHHPAGPADPKVPVLVLRGRERQTPLAAMVVCSMHPTVLHEDSTLVSGDFPAMARQYLAEHVLGQDCPIIFHTGPCGDQSPRHVTRTNTVEEAVRLGHRLGGAIAEGIRAMEFRDTARLGCLRTTVELPRRILPSVSDARAQLDEAVRRLDALRRSGADRSEVRTAECDWFGAEEKLVLAQAAATGRLDDVVASVMPAEITLVRIGRWTFVGWPGEVFVEFSLQVQASCPDCYVISMANGQLQGYLTTEEAVRQGWYESGNSLFANPEAGTALVNATRELLEQLPAPSATESTRRE